MSIYRLWSILSSDWGVGSGEWGDEGAGEAGENNY